MNRIMTFLRESSDEVRNKMSWPKFDELQSSAILVLVASLILAMVIFVMDSGFKNVLAWFYREF